MNLWPTHAGQRPYKIISHTYKTLQKCSWQWGRLWQWPMKEERWDYKRNRGKTVQNITMSHIKIAIIQIQSVITPYKICLQWTSDEECLECPMSSKKQWNILPTKYRWIWEQKLEKIQAKIQELKYLIGEMKYSVEGLMSIITDAEDRTSEFENEVQNTADNRRWKEPKNNKQITREL